MGLKLLALIVVAVVVLLLLLFVGRRVVLRRRDLRTLHHQIHTQEGCYVFLIDRKLDVLDTNYYELNPKRRKHKPYRLGNVLRCQTGTDCGMCGTGFACNTCPVRLCLSNAFKQKHDFNNVSAVMTLYSLAKEPQPVNVRLSGKRVYVGDEPHMLVTVVELDKE